MSEDLPLQKQSHDREMSDDEWSSNSSYTTDSNGSSRKHSAQHSDGQLTTLDDERREKTEALQKDWACFNMLLVTKIFLNDDKNVFPSQELLEDIVSDYM